MSRIIKFRAWDRLRNEFYKARENDGVSPYIGFHVFGECALLCPPQIEDLQHIVIEQFTGLHDLNGNDIYEGDLLNIFYTSGDGEHIHDCVYEVCFGILGIEFRFKRLLWESFGYNQYPLSTILCERYGSLGVASDGVYVPDSYGKNHTSDFEWKQNDRSNYLVVIGNIHQNPELLK